MAATVVENRNLMCCMGLPCFVHNTDTDDDEEIVCSSKGGNTAASPGEDVWRKLGFPPTPPRSPTKSFGEITQNHSTIAERLQLVFESLDDCFGHVDSLPNLDSLSLRSKLIQDCMWNGIVSEREKCLTFIESIYDTPCSTPPPLDYSSSDCVDPSSVFPYPLNESKQQTQSEDSDEEIDVVSIDKPDLKRKLSEPLLDDHSEVKVLKRTKSLPNNRPGNKSLPSKKSTTTTSADDASSSDASSTKSSRAGSKASSSSSPSSLASVATCEDSDSDKRASHNVLERKRRNDLKSSFYTLRSYVPSLLAQEKAAKVVILKKATDYISELKFEEEELALEKEDLKCKQRELLEKFIKLKPKVELNN